MSVAEALARPDVRVYAQPGADGDDTAAFRRQRRDKAVIRDFVAQGAGTWGSAWVDSWPSRGSSTSSAPGGRVYSSGAPR